MTEEMKERFALAKEKIKEIRDITYKEPDDKDSEALFDYFFEAANLTVGVFSVLDRKESKMKEPSLADYFDEQKNLYGWTRKEAYETSFLNPDTAVKKFGKTLGQALSAVFMDYTAIIPWSYEGREDLILIFLELLIELYSIFEDKDRTLYLPHERDEKEREVLSSVRSFYHDYSDIFDRENIENLILPEKSAFFTDIIEKSDFKDPRYLFLYGSKIGSDELGLWEYLSALDESVIEKMAGAYASGYIKGFAENSRDISIKETVSLDYPIGFERVMRAAVKIFNDKGLKVTVKRSPLLSCQHRGVRRGVYTNAVDPQIFYDHKDDVSIYLDRAYINRRLEVISDTFEKNRRPAAVYGGPAVVETFGEKKFDPVNKGSATETDDKKSKLLLEFTASSAKITNDYIRGDERSFTIISWPIPSIGPDFKDIMKDTIEINTLDSEKFRRIQQSIVDALDRGYGARITGSGDNRTDITVRFMEKDDPDKQTVFENCVADVNIPVGEVFTSPKLKGTKGTINVKSVYLNGFIFKNLLVQIEDGRAVKISCTNFDSEEENRRYIDDHILFRHKTLPLGEFAIGTNTLAYVMARKYGIEDRMPILIAEKTGPHFALGDTCYSHAEDVKVYNPDGREIISRDNEITREYRKTDPGRAYFNCHTDITLPYDELDAIEVLHEDGSSEDIIRSGRFVLPGTEELNEALRREK